MSNNKSTKSTENSEKIGKICSNTTPSLTKPHTSGNSGSTEKSGKKPSLSSSKKNLPTGSGKGKKTTGTLPNNTETAFTASTSTSTSTATTGTAKGTATATSTGNPTLTRTSTGTGTFAFGSKEAITENSSVEDPLSPVERASISSYISSPDDTTLCTTTHGNSRP